jgi:hypothetical protein
MGSDACTCLDRSGKAPGFPYGDKVVFLANDWHAGLVPVYIAGKYRQHGVYKVCCICCQWHGR